ncbi:MAG TPA: hypothetical protein VJJ78_00130 [Candidatus Saccharimonadales bacterium]|nr:hypothetical protein [Candidatus Saccharimonadales bacterium]
MSNNQPYLCDGCPGKGNGGVDFDVSGFCFWPSSDSFRQTRRYRIECPDDYSSNEEMAELSSSFLRYYDPEEDDFYEGRGDISAARLGILCAEQFLAGNCAKTEQQILRDSEID